MTSLHGKSSKVASMNQTLLFYSVQIVCSHAVGVTQENMVLFFKYASSVKLQVVSRHECCMKLFQVCDFWCFDFWTTLHDLFHGLYSVKGPYHVHEFLRLDVFVGLPRS